MANIRIKDLPSDSAPNQNDVIPIDLAGTRGATVKDVVESGRPTASKSEAEAGVDPQKAMTPLTTKQAIDAQVSAAYVPKTVKVNAGDGLTGGGELSGDVTVGLTTTNIDRLNKVDGVEAGAQVNTVNSVNAKTGNVVLSAGDVGLGNVDNTSDASKPISTATQAALDDKANSSVTISAGSGLTGGGTLAANRTIALSSASIASLALADSAVQSVNGKAGSSVTLTKSDVGLGNVDNTSDDNKPISSATQAALNAKANSSVTVSAGAGLTGGGNLTANRSISLNAASIASLEKADTALQAPGGETGQVLAKASDDDNAVVWVSSEAATAVSYGPQELTEAQQEQARANIGALKEVDATKSALLDSDSLIGSESSGSSIFKTTWANIKAALSSVFLPLTGGTLTGSVGATQFRPTGAVGTHNYLTGGTGDGASYSTYNMSIRSHWGLGMVGHDGAVNGYYNARTGTWDVKGGYLVNGKPVIIGDWASHVGFVSDNPASPYIRHGTTGSGSIIELARKADVMPIIASQGPTGIGTYAFLYWTGGTGSVSPGGQEAGSALRWSSAWGNSDTSAPGGSWRCFGWCDTGTQTSRTTLWMRYA